MRATTAYFAGVGTVVVAVATGLGGGLLLGDIMSPQGSKTADVNRLERRASPYPIPEMNAAAQPVPFMAAAQVAATVEASQPSPQPPRQAEPRPSQQAQPQAQQASTRPVEPKPSPEESAAASTQPPEPSAAKARDSESRRDARRADDRRKAERRQQWAEKRKWRQREGDELNDVETSVREATESRPLFREPAFGTGRVTLFDD
jgi:hypothetical protein